MSGLTPLRPTPEQWDARRAFGLGHGTTARSRTGNRDECDLPVDLHELIAPCTPRLTFISYGVPERGDAHWLDEQDSFMATVAAVP